MKEIKLESGSTIKFDLPPFAESKELFQVCLEEMKNLGVDEKADIDVNLFKNLFCVSFGSKKIEEKLHECMKRVLYNGQLIKADTFEKEEAREDYLMVCFEVGKAVISPFLKGLTAQLIPQLRGLLTKSSQK